LFRMWADGAWHKPYFIRLDGPAGGLEADLVKETHDMQFVGCGLGEAGAGFGPFTGDGGLHESQVVV
jgi:hypothetical protein